MRCRWAEWVAIPLVLIAPTSVLAQGQELGIGAIGTLSDPALAVGSAYGALRTSGRTRVSGSFGVGAAGSELAWRGELLGHFLFSPEERRNSGFYFAGGIAVVGGPFRRGYLILTLGLEARPRGGSGWAVEAGLGGGFRMAAGYRWRWFPVSTQ
jgi:hypothetical protein